MSATEIDPYRVEIIDCGIAPKGTHVDWVAQVTFAVRPNATTDISACLIYFLTLMPGGRVEVWEMWPNGQSNRAHGYPECLIPMAREALATWVRQ